MSLRLEYQVKIDAFEGPLDLLLHLINRLEIDIYDIPVSQITEQYLLYIHTMKELQLDVASEYLVMAATLLSIKSKMLLPKQEEELFDEELNLEQEEDPRDELMRRLIDYRRYKEAAGELKTREEERALVYTKAPSDLSEYAQEPMPDKAPLDISVYDMLSAFQKVMRRKKLQKPLQTKIARQEIPIEKRMNEILADLASRTGRCNFTDLFPEASKEYLVVTFLAVLELMKSQKITIQQEGNFQDLYITGSGKSN